MLVTTPSLVNRTKKGQLKMFQEGCFYWKVNMCSHITSAVGYFPMHSQEYAMWYPDHVITKLLAVCAVLKGKINAFSNETA